jgi:hypothetical protein
MGWQTQAVTVLHAGNTIINPNGIFTYSLAGPGAGNLISSDVPAGITQDTYGNAIPNNSYTSYFNTGAGWTAINLASGVITWYTAASEAGPWSAISGIGFGSLGAITITPGAGGTIQLGNFATPIPIADPTITSLPTDANSGSTWVSGERAFMNTNWVGNINSNFTNIVTALRNAGIFA